MSLQALLAAAAELEAMNGGAVLAENIDLPVRDLFRRMHAAALAALVLDPLLGEALETIRDCTRKVDAAYPAVDSESAVSIGVAVAIVRGIIGEMATAPIAAVIESDPPATSEPPPGLLN